MSFPAGTLGSFDLRAFACSEYICRRVIPVICLIVGATVILGVLAYTWSWPKHADNRAESVLYDIGAAQSQFMAQCARYGTLQELTGCGLLSLEVTESGSVSGPELKVVITVSADGTRYWARTTQGTSMYFLDSDSGLDSAD